MSSFISASQLCFLHKSVSSDILLSIVITARISYTLIDRFLGTSDKPKNFPPFERGKVNPCNKCAYSAFKFKACCLEVGNVRSTVGIKEPKMSYWFYLTQVLNITEDLIDVHML